MPPAKEPKRPARKRRAPSAPDRASLLRQLSQLRRQLTQRDRHISELNAQYTEAADTLEAIRTGAVDAVVVSGAPGGERVYTLTGAEQSYRLLVETVNAGAVTLALDGM